jgi:hypothetical protein
VAAGAVARRSSNIVVVGDAIRGDDRRLPALHRVRRRATIPGRNRLRRVRIADAVLASSRQRRAVRNEP